MDKVALITGSTQGIGLGIAISLAKANYNIIICGSRPESDASESIEKLKKYNIEVLYCQCDISKKESRSKMIESIKNKFGYLNILVNNAGVAPKTRTDILDSSEESYERVMKINLQGPYFLTQAVANWMIELKENNSNFDSYIINISSISATTASPGRGEYCLSKAGISMATKLFATRLGEYNIPVYEIRPGIIKTEMTSTVKDKYDKLISNGLLLQSRWGLPEDIGKAVAMMVNGDIAYSTGQVINIDGGFNIERL